MFVGVLEVRVGVQVFKSKFHTNIHFYLVKKKNTHTHTHTYTYWCDGHSISISICEVWGARARVLVFKMEFYTHIYLD